MDRCVLGVDVQGYSKRNTRRQGDIHRDLDRVLGEAAASAGLDRSQWIVSHTGDGENAVMPADVDLMAVIGRFVPALHSLLAVRNEDCVPEMRIRLRVAVHIDTLTISMGTVAAGPAHVVLSRLLDSDAVRDALAQAERSELALIVSTPVYEKVVLSGLAGVSPEQYAAVQVDLAAKGFRHTGYVHVPGHDMHTFAPERPAAVAVVPAVEGGAASPTAGIDGEEAGPADTADRADPGGDERPTGGRQPAPAPAPNRTSSVTIGGNLTTGGDFVGGDYIAGR